MKIKILDHVIKVDIEDPGMWKQGVLGMASITTSGIKLSSDLEPDIKQSTFLHEVLHIIEQLNGLDVGHPAIDMLAVGLHSLFKNQPNILKDILK